ncbi:MAG: hypothetical protein WCK84_11980 [Bacteroidota bacterium]
MKATTVIMAAVLTLQGSILFAGNESSAVPVRNESYASTLIMLAPTTPLEATFEDAASEMVSNFELAPVTPTVADFEDAILVLTVDNRVLAPVTPAEADFE